MRVLPVRSRADGAAGTRKRKRQRAPGAGRPAVLREPVRFSLQIEQAALRALVALATHRGVTVGQVIRDAIDAALRQ